jgi:hypothetical protein
MGEHDIRNIRLVERRRRKNGKVYRYYDVPLPPELLDRSNINPKAVFQRDAAILYGGKVITITLTDMDGVE